MLTNTYVPTGTKEYLNWQWQDFSPHYQALTDIEITPSTIDGWLKKWSDLLSVSDEIYTRLFVATTQYTSDEKVEAAFNDFIENTQPAIKKADQVLKQKLLTSGITPKDFDLPLKKLRAETEIFCEENLPLLVEEQKLCNEYNRLIGGITFLWEGEERTASQMFPLFFEPDRAVREKAWRITFEGRYARRAELNTLWGKLLRLRSQIAKNKGFDNYRSMMWKAKFRFDYTPEDCMTFHNAIQQVVVPAVQRINKRRATKLGISSIRPWDNNVEVNGTEPLKPFTDVQEFLVKTRQILARVDESFGDSFQEMIEGGLLDIPSRKNKAPGAYSLGYAVERKPFIFMSANGTHDDVQTMLHESGHAMHEFLRQQLDYFHNRAENYLPFEFAEVASMSMELIASPFTVKQVGGFYDQQEYARSMINNLEGIVKFWPYMALVDHFQHWIYENETISQDGEVCEKKWAELWDLYMPSIDYAGLDEAKKTYWHRQSHIFTSPLYYIEYGMAQLGAVQIWGNSLNDQNKAIANYIGALKLGSTVGLPQLFAAAGAEFKFDVPTLQRSVDLIERNLEALENQLLR